MRFQRLIIVVESDCDCLYFAVKNNEAQCEEIYNWYPGSYSEPGEVGDTIDSYALVE